MFSFNFSFSFFLIINRSGVLLTFVSNDRMSNALDAGKTTGHNVVDEAKGFIEQTVKVNMQGLAYYCWPIGRQFFPDSM